MTLYSLTVPASAMLNDPELAALVEDTVRDHSIILRVMLTKLIGNNVALARQQNKCHGTCPHQRSYPILDDSIQARAHTI